MVLRGAKARKLKAVKLIGKPERSLYVAFRNQKKVDKSKIVEILSKAHPDIQWVYLPRQKIPKFVYVLCKGVEEKEPVRETLKKLKNPDLGHLYVFDSKGPKKKPEISEEDKAKAKRGIDRRCVVLELLPKELTNETLEEEFPEAEKVVRFNKRRCYLYFKKKKDAMKARIRIAKEEIAGHKLKGKFNKLEVDDEEVKVEVKDEEEDSEQSSD